MKKIIMLAFLMLFFNQQIIRSQQNIETGNPIAERFQISLEGGVIYPETDFQRSLTDYMLKGRFGYFFDLGKSFTMGLDVSLSQGYAAGDQTATFRLPRVESFRTSMTMLGGGITFNYTLFDFIVPYVGGGLHFISFEPEIKDINGLTITPVYNGEVVNYNKYNFISEIKSGFRFLVSENVLLSINGGINFFSGDDLDWVPNEISNGTANDIFFSGTLGLGLLIGGKKDSDGDGVPDKLDMCPETPAGVKVDEFGCPVDSDGDGVPDYLDECPNTPPGYLVDDSGCIVDTDNDGVPDDIDKCPYTPAGVEVDEFGCPVDSDGDGVPDYLDGCLDTPSGYYVNEYGCVLWVPDFVTNPNQKLVLYVDQLFTDDQTLNDFAKSEISFIAKRLNESGYPEWAILGHTDNTGDYTENRFKSLEWANVIYFALAESGMDSTNLKTTGFGPEHPIATNATEDGRSQNRRIEIYPVQTEIPKVKEPEIIEDKKTQTPPAIPIAYGKVLPYNYDNEKNVTDVILTDGLNFCIQLSTWRNKQRADEVASIYRKKGFNAFVTETSIPNVSGYFYKVRVGFFSSLTEARETNKAINEIEVK